MYYELNKAGLTHDEKLYHKNNIQDTIAQYQKDQTGPLGSFPFGSFAWARLDERLEKYPEYANAPRKPGRDPMGLTKHQPHIELWNFECYGGLDLTDIPANPDTHVFSIATIFMNPHSRGTVTCTSADPMEIPTVDHNYLNHPLDMLVMSEACKFSHEVVMNGKATRDVIKGPWPRNSPGYDSWKTREEWVPFVRSQAGTCKSDSALAEASC